MIICILNTSDDTVDVVLQKNERGSIYTKLEKDETFMQELYRLVEQFPQDYTIWVHDYNKKIHQSIELSKDNIKHLNQKLDYNKSIKFLTGK